VALVEEVRCRRAWRAGEAEQSRAHPRQAGRQAGRQGDGARARQGAAGASTERVSRELGGLRGVNVGPVSGASLRFSRCE
jgi:hypothetical protein